jgi:hypothetical protein
VVFIGVFLLARYSPSKARVFDLATVLMAFTNVVTDVLFINFLAEQIVSGHDFQKQYYSAITFLLLPIVFNICISTWSLMRLMCGSQAPVMHPCGTVRLTSSEWKQLSRQNKNALNEKPGPSCTFRHWFRQTITTSTLIYMLSWLSVDCLSLYTSEILWLLPFSAPWPQGELLVMILGLVDVVVKDIPHLIIQINVTQSTQTWGALQVVSISSSALAVLFGVVKRCIALALWHADNKTADSSSQPQHTGATHLTAITPSEPAASPPGGKLILSPSSSEFVKTAWPATNDALL